LLAEASRFCAGDPEGLDSTVKADPRAHPTGIEPCELRFRSLKINAGVLSQLLVAGYSFGTGLPS
jgi:hypothetical protein